MNMTAQADISNWREAPHSQWAFHNIDKILSTHTIRKGSTPISLKSGKAKTFSKFKLRLDDGTEHDWSSYLESTETDGVIVLKDGNVIHEQYFHGNNAQSKHILMSVSKSICGLMAGILVGEGKLDVSAPVTKYIPELSTSAFANKTIRQCLDMRTNIQYEDATPAYRAAAGWNPPRPTQESSNGTEQTAQNLHDLFFTFKPQGSTPANTDGEGGGFKYESLNTDLMTWIIERAAGDGESYAELVSRLLWQPLGAASDALMTVDKAGNARGAGGLCATLRDLARIGRLVARTGGGIVPARWFDDMLENAPRDAFATGAWEKTLQGVFTRPAYRSYWVTDRELDIFMGVGIHGQHIFVDAKNDIVLVKTSSQVLPIDEQKVRGAAQAFREVQRVLGAQ